MPYKSRRRFTKKRFPKSTRKAVRREIKSVLARQVETKSQFLNNGETAEDVPSSGVVTDLTDIILQNNTPFGRIGDLIHLKSVSVDVRVMASTGGFFLAADSYNYVRCIVFRYNGDGAPSSSQALGQIFEIPSDPAPIHHPFLYRNVDFMPQYNVLYDRRVKVTPVLNYTGTDNDVVTYNVSGPSALGHFRIRLSGKKLGSKNVRYSSAGGDASTTHGGVFLMLISDSSASPHPQVFYNARVSYTDS